MPLTEVAALQEKNLRAACRCLIVSVLAIGSGACNAENAPLGSVGDLLAIDTSASQSLNADAFNQELAAAHSQNQPWANDPVQIINKFLNPEMARNAVWTFSGSGERSTRYQVAITTDGFPNDSVRGKRYAATLERVPNGGWQIRNASVSWRCWRTRTGVFGIEPCS
jgi:hypothetical protein